MSVSVTTKKIRMSYPVVFTPKKTDDGSAPRYSMKVLIPKSDTETYNRIKDAIRAVYEEGKNSTFKGKRLDLSNLDHPGMKIPLHDGDGYSPNGNEYKPEDKGNWVLSVASKNKPAVVDRNRRPVTDETQVYGGCYGRVSINIYPYQFSGGGIAAGLNGVLTYGYGEPFGNSFSADSAFNDGYEDPDDEGEDDDLL